jgi:hypothetical protein
VSETTIDGRAAGGFDPPLVRGADGEYYFAVLGKDSDGTTHQFYLPAPADPGWLTILEEDGRERYLRFDGHDVADPRDARGRFVRFRAFEHALALEVRHRGEIIYVPVVGTWGPSGEDPNRYVFALRAAPGVPDSRALQYWTLDTFLTPEQTYHYRTRGELTGSSAPIVLGGLALLAGWWFSLWGLGLTLYAAASGHSVSADTLAAVSLIAAPTFIGTALLVHRSRKEGKPYYLRVVPDVTLPWGAPPHSSGAEGSPDYLGRGRAPDCAPSAPFFPSSEASEVRNLLLFTPSGPCIASSVWWTTRAITAPCSPPSMSGAA